MKNTIKMNKKLWNNPIARRYLSQLITDCEAHEYHFKNEDYPVTQMSTFLESEKELIERSTYDKTIKFLKGLEEKGAVKMLPYVSFLEESGLNTDEVYVEYKFLNPYEEVYVEKETRVRPINKKILSKILTDLESEVNLDISPTSGLFQLSKKHTLHFTSEGTFKYGRLGGKNKLILDLRKGSRSYLILSSVLKRTLLGDAIVSYQQIEDDVPSVLSDKQKSYPRKDREIARNKNISNCVTIIQKAIDRLVERSVKQGDEQGTGLVYVATVHGAGVEMKNPRFK